MSERSVVPTRQKVTLPASGGVLQRKCACGQHSSGGECEGCWKKKQNLQRKESGTEPNGVPAIVHDVLHSPGQPLDIAARIFMESRFGQDFSRVRVHTDTLAAHSADAVNALAFTVGQDIVFQHGRYQPTTSSGSNLLAHELVHTIQQDTSPGQTHQNLQSISQPGDAAEREAEAVAASVLHGGTQLEVSSQGTQLARKDDADKSKGVKVEPEASTCALTSFTASNFSGDKVKADVEFVKGLEKINKYAVSNNVKVYVTSSFRTSTNVKGAIVKPAKMSNHLAGHAIDMNILYGVSKSKLCNGDCLSGELPDGVSGFIAAIQKDSGLRWGGDFSDKDPVHIDDHLNSDTQAWRDRVEAVQKARKEGCG